MQSRHIEIPAADHPAARLAVRIAGEGPLAILIHGFPLDHRMWHGVLEGELARRRTLCAIDLRGHGASPASSLETHAMDCFGDDIAEVIRQLQAEREGDAADHPVDIAGLSMGGYAAFALHARHPQLVRSLVLSNTRAAADTDAQRTARQTSIDTVRSHGQAPIADAMLPKLVHTSAAPAVRDELRTMIEAQPVGTIIADQRGLQQRPDRTSELAGIRVPTLVAVGEHDAITPPAEAQQMAAAIPGASLQVIPNTGHMSPMEDPTAWSQVVAALWR